MNAKKIHYKTIEDINTVHDLTTKVVSYAQMSSYDEIRIVRRTSFKGTSFIGLIDQGEGVVAFRLRSEAMIKRVLPTLQHFKKDKPIDLLQEMLDSETDSEKVRENPPSGSDYSEDFQKLVDQLLETRDSISGLNELLDALVDLKDWSSSNADL